MYTSPSPLTRRGPLRLPFSVHIRKLFFLFLSLFSGAPRWTRPVGAGVPDGPHRFSFTLPAGLFRTPMDAPRRGRRPRRPASFFFHASGGAISRSGATSFCPRRQKDARTSPKTHGLWNSFRPLAITAQKGPHRIAPAPIPAAAPMHHTAALCSPNIKNPRPSGPHIHLPPVAASARFDNRPSGRPAHPPRRMRERQR